MSVLVAAILACLCQEGYRVRDVVLELVDEEVVQPTDVQFVAPASVDLGNRWKIRFAADGPVGGSVSGKTLPSGVLNAGQYR